MPFSNVILVPVEVYSVDLNSGVSFAVSSFFGLGAGLGTASATGSGTGVGLNSSSKSRNISSFLSSIEAGIRDISSSISCTSLKFDSSFSSIELMNSATSTSLFPSSADFAYKALINSFLSSVPSR